MLLVGRTLDGNEWKIEENGVFKKEFDGGNGLKSDSSKPDGHLIFIASLKHTCSTISKV